MIPLLQEPARASGARIVFSCGFDSIPFDLGVVFLQDEAQRRFGMPLARVHGRVRKMSGKLSGGTIASALATIEQVVRDPAAARTMADPFALTPGFKGPRQPEGEVGRLRRSRQVVDGAVRHGRDQHQERAPHQRAARSSLGARLRLRRAHAGRRRRRGRAAGEENDERDPDAERDARLRAHARAAAALRPAQAGRGPRRAGARGGRLRAAVPRPGGRRAHAAGVGARRGRSRLRVHLQDDLGKRAVPAQRRRSHADRRRRMDPRRGDGTEADPAAAGAGGAGLRDRETSRTGRAGRPAAARA